MAEHIQKVQDRNYVTLDASRRLTPTVLGIGLVDGMCCVRYVVRLARPAVACIWLSPVSPFFSPRL